MTDTPSPVALRGEILLFMTEGHRDFPPAIVGPFEVLRDILPEDMERYLASGEAGGFAYVPSRSKESRSLMQDRVHALDQALKDVNPSGYFRNDPLAVGFLAWLEQDGALARRPVRTVRVHTSTRTDVDNRLVCETRDGGIAVRDMAPASTIRPDDVPSPLTSPAGTGIPAP